LVLKFRGSVSLFRRCALALLAVLAGIQGAWAGGCVDPRDYANGVVRIERVVAGGAPHSWVGSGWFYQSPQVLITNEHVVSKLGLQEQEWTNVLLQTSKPDASRGYIQRTKARVLARDTRDDIALVLLEYPVMGVRPMDIKTGAVSPGEPLAIAGYASGLLQFGNARAYTGPQPVARFRQPASQFAIDVQGAANQAAFSAGGSGSPVLNCEGLVVGIFSNLIDERYLSLFGSSGTRGRPASAASPNAFAIRIESLRSLYASLAL
jgi:S1-C subfamily serine protease